MASWYREDTRLYFAELLVAKARVAVNRRRDDAIDEKPYADIPPAIWTELADGIYEVARAGGLTVTAGPPMSGKVRVTFARRRGETGDGCSIITGIANPAPK